MCRLLRRCQLGLVHQVPHAGTCSSCQDAHQEMLPAGESSRAGKARAGRTMQPTFAHPVAMATAYTQRFPVGSERRFLVKFLHSPSCSAPFSQFSTKVGQMGGQQLLVMVPALALGMSLPCSLLGLLTRMRMMCSCRDTLGLHLQLSAKCFHIST